MTGRSLDCIESGLPLRRYSFSYRVSDAYSQLHQRVVLALWLGSSSENDDDHRVTCGLRIVSDPTPSHLSPSRTISDDAAQEAVDGPGLPCPGSTGVADSDSSNHN
jgi:hypothetical protein